MKQTMLIADGDAELCDLYRIFVKDHGYDVETSSNGMDCVRKLRRETPDVLVLDLELLWGGGAGVLGWLRDEPKYLPSRAEAILRQHRDHSEEEAQPDENP